VIYIPFVAILVIGLLIWLLPLTDEEFDRMMQEIEKEEK
jgi:Na+/melibiose symporter-like transporter